MGGSSRDYKASISFPNPPTVRPMKKRNSAFSTDLGDMVTHGWIFSGMDDGAESKNCLCAWAGWKKDEHILARMWASNHPWSLIVISFLQQ